MANSLMKALVLLPLCLGAPAHWAQAEVITFTNSNTSEMLFGSYNYDIITQSFADISLQFNFSSLGGAASLPVGSSSGSFFEHVHAADGWFLFGDATLTANGIVKARLSEVVSEGGDLSITEASLTFARSGALPPVPEPALWAMMAAGLLFAKARGQGRRPVGSPLSALPARRPHVHGVTKP